MILSRSKRSQNAEVRSPLIWGVLILGVVLVCVVAVLVFRSGKEPAPDPRVRVTNATPVAPVASAPAEPVLPPRVVPPTTGTVAVATLPERPNRQPVPPAADREAASVFTSQLVDSLAQVGLDGGPITAEKAAAWNNTLQRLIGEGGKAVPAIRDFLERNVDLNVSALEGGDQFSQPTLRLALLDALWQIGGEGAVNLSVQTLGSASDPREIAALADYLDQQAPDQYRSMAVNAARESLAMAGAKQLEGRDVGPLFDVFKRYGDANVVNDLVSAVGQWKYYAAISLAELPENQGIQALLQMADNPNNPSSSTRLVATEMLAQHVTQSPEALNVILQQAQSGKLPDATWLTIASVLEGHQFGIGDVPLEMQAPTTASSMKRFHLAYGNQNYYSVVPTEGWSEPEIGSRVAIIDQLLSTNPSDMAVRALQQARGSLASRLPAE